MNRSYGGVTCFADGLPRMGKTTFLQRCARERIGKERTFWWGEARPQWGTFYPNHYQLLVQGELSPQLVRQWPGEAREEPVPFRTKTGLVSPKDFYKASDPDLVNVLVYDPEERADRLLEFLEFLNQRPGLEYVTVIVDETAKIAPGAAKREDRSYYRGLKFARILEDTGKAYVSVYMSSHFPTDLWYVCIHKIQFTAAFAGQYNPKHRHSRQAHHQLRVGQFYLEGPTLSGARYDKVEVAPPPDDGGRLFLRLPTKELNGMRGPTGGRTNNDWPKSAEGLARMFGTTVDGLRMAVKRKRIPRSWLNAAEAAEDPDQ